MALQYLFDPNKQFQSRNGVNAVNGFLRVYLNGTDDRATTYRNFDGGLNEPDIVLDTDGRAVVIVDDTKTYRLEVYNRLGGLMWTVSNYKARGGSGGSGTPVSVEGTAGEIDVYENTVGGVKHFVVSLAATIKNAISSLTSAVNGLEVSLGRKKELQIQKSFEGSTTKTPTSFTQDANGELDVEFDDIAFPDWTSEINAATDLCEKLANKKTTFSGFETSDTYYPTLKGVVDYLDGRLQNLGGKKITNNGVPFTTASQLPTTTPYYGQNINSNDYAYVQDTGIASRYTAIVTNSSVAWSLDYEIAIPVFTPEQQAAIDSGATATKIGNYDSHIANATIHVTSTEKHTWNAKQNAIGDLAEIRSGAAAGATALQPNGNGSNVISTFTIASSRTNISSGEKLSTIFGKIAKWLADLKALAFRDTVGTSQIEDDSVTAAKVKDNETLPVHISGTAESSKRFNDEVGTSGVDGHRAIFGGIDSGNNAKISMSERTGGVSKSTEITPSGISTTGGMIIGGDIIIGGTNPATDVKDNSNLAILIASKASKASSGNGNLAVIDANGNYASSGISAYDQSQINSLIINNAKPWIEAASYVQTQSFFMKVTQALTGQALQFRNAYTGEKLLQVKLNYRYDVGTVELSLRMDIDWNSWIKSVSGGGALVTANGTKHTVNSGTDTVNPFFDYTETSILSTETSDVVIGTFDIGKSSLYDTNSYYDFMMNIFNLNSGKSVTLKITLMTKRIHNPGAGVWANLIGMATLDASGFNV